MKMTTKKYIQPETDVVPLSTKHGIMGVGGDDTVLTSDNLTNSFHLDNDFDEGLDNAYTPHQINPWDK